MNAPAVLDRKTYLGGSDAAAFLGVSPWQSPFMLYQKKIGELIDQPSPDKEKLFKRGKRWEPIVIEMLIDELKEQGHDVEVIARNQRYQDPEFPFIAAELDMELLVDGEEMNGEAKTVNPFALKEWGDEETDAFPIYYQAQTMYGLMVKPRQRCVVAALTGFDDRPKIYWIDRDEEIIAGIRAKAIAFWDCIQNRTPPAPVTIEDIKFLYPKDAGLIMQADQELLSLCQQLKDAKATAKQTEGLVEALTTRLKLRMGFNAILMFEGKPAATWNTNKSSTVTNWEAIATELKASAEIIKKYTSEKIGARPLLIK